MNDKDILTLKEIAQDVDKLIKIFLEMKIVTKYKKGEEFNIQRLSLWSYNIQNNDEIRK